MNRRRNLLISMTAALLSGALVYGVYVLQLKQVELQKTIDVIVPRDFIPTGTMITAEMVESMPIALGAVNGRQQYLATELTSVVGTEAVVPLGTLEPILLWKVDRFHLCLIRLSPLFRFQRITFLPYPMEFGLEIRWIYIFRAERGNLADYSSIASELPR
ncbi:MAG: hypothetical protein K0Q81_2219 [Paenibacillus sp.]|nr:hypothetical protein [Paenibacillus sp.]